MSIAEETPVETLEFAIKRLAKLSEIEYESVREAEAKKSNIRIGKLDQFVANERSIKDEYNDDVVTKDKPYSEEVNGIALLSEIETLINKHMILPSGALSAITLWVVLTYLYNNFRVFPRLAVISPEKRCGKSTLLDLLSGLSNSPLLTSNISPAAVFRSIDLWHPTLIIDEADTFLANRNDDVIGILNSGHTKTTAYVVRSEGEDHTPKKFNTWSPVAFASIKGLASTIMDRSIIIQLRRKIMNEKVKRVPVDFKEHQSLLRQKLTRFAQDNEASLKRNQIEPPEITNDRAIDNWLPLFTLAHTIGGDWPDKVNTAYITLNQTEDTQSAAVMLLTDIKYIFEVTKKHKIFSADLVKELIAIEERPWCEWKGGKALTQNSMAKMLRTFGIHSKNMRIDTVKRGYDFSDFNDAFDRYIPLPSTPEEQSATPLQTSHGLTVNNIVSATTSLPVALNNSHKASSHAPCSTVALKTQNKEADTPDTYEQTII